MTWRKNKLLPFDPKPERTLHNTKGIIPREEPPYIDQSWENPHFEEQQDQIPQLEEQMANRALRDYVMPNLDVVRGSINRPTITTNKFEIKLAMIQMIQSNL